MNKKDFLTDQDVRELVLSNSTVTLSVFKLEDTEPKYGKSVFLKYNHTTGVFIVIKYNGKGSASEMSKCENVKCARERYNKEVELCLNGK